jgi:hypothetical protein
MLSKCAHATCFAQFRYLRQGKVFKVFMPSHGDKGHRVEYFWLCSGCAQIFKVVAEHGFVTTHPLHLQLTAGPPAQFLENEIRKVA